jgi:hypothetical protein
LKYMSILNLSTATPANLEDIVSPIFKFFLNLVTLIIEDIILLLPIAIIEWISKIILEGSRNFYGYKYEAVC